MRCAFDPGKNYPKTGQWDEKWSIHVKQSQISTFAHSESTHIEHLLVWIMDKASCNLFIVFVCIVFVLWQMV